MKHLLLAALLVVGSSGLGHETAGSDDQELRSTIARFYEGWNEHDADKMVSV